jgi:hypothetical protein
MHSTTTELVPHSSKHSAEKLEVLGEMEQRLNSFFDSEGVHM